MDVTVLPARWKQYTFNASFIFNDKVVSSFTDIAQGCKLSFYNTNLLFKLNRPKTEVLFNGRWVSVWHYLTDVHRHRTFRLRRDDVFFDELPDEPPPLERWSLVVKREGSRILGRVKGLVTALMGTTCRVLWLDDHILESLPVNSIACIVSQPVHAEFRALLPAQVGIVSYSPNTQGLHCVVNCHVRLEPQDDLLTESDEEVGHVLLDLL